MSVRPLVVPSLGPSVGPLVTFSLFGLLGATYGRVSGLVYIRLPSARIKCEGFLSFSLPFALALYLFLDSSSHLNMRGTPYIRPPLNGP